MSVAFHEAHKYARAIRNERKRRYAEWLIARVAKGEGFPKNDDGGLSIMGAQAVRMRLRKLIPEELFGPREAA